MKLDAAEMGVCVQGPDNCKLFEGNEQNAKSFLNARYFVTISNDNNMAKEIAGTGQMAQSSEHLLFLWDSSVPGTSTSVHNHS